MITLRPLLRHMKLFKERRYLEERMAKRFGRSSREFRLIMHAADAIRDTHRGKGKRKNDESRLVHEREMAGIADFFDVNDWVVYIVIFSHDGPEDYRRHGWSFKRVKRDYGKAAYYDVRALTNPVRCKTTSDHSYNMLLVQQWRKGGKRTIFIKGIDRLHCLLNPWSGGRHRMIKKKNATLRYLIPLMVEFGLNTYPLVTATGILQRKYRLTQSI